MGRRYWSTGKTEFSAAKIFLIHFFIWAKKFSVWNGALQADALDAAAQLCEYSPSPSSVSLTSSHSQPQSASQELDGGDTTASSSSNSFFVFVQRVKEILPESSHHLLARAYEIEGFFSLFFFTYSRLVIIVLV